MPVAGLATGSRPDPVRYASAGPASRRPWALGLTQTQEASCWCGTDPGCAACIRGAAQTIITMAVTSSSNPAAPVSTVDLERAPLTTAFIVGIPFFPVETPYALNVRHLVPGFRWCWPPDLTGGVTTTLIRLELRRD